MNFSTYIGFQNPLIRFDTSYANLIGATQLWIKFRKFWNPKSALILWFRICLFHFCFIQWCTGQPLKLLPANPHYFQYKNKPTLLVGSGEHYGALINSAFDLDVYFNALKQSGLNHTRLFMGTYYEKPGAFGIQKNTLAPDSADVILPWKKEGAKFDLTVWNDEYFTRLHQLMKLAEQHDVVVEINLFSSYYGAGWSYHPFHANQNKNGTSADLDYHKAHTKENGKLLQYQELYVRKLVKELNPYDHFYFEIQNEPWADLKDTFLIWNQNLMKEELKVQGNFWKNTIEIPSRLSYEWHQTVSDWIVKEEKNLAKQHLISHNIANFKLPVSVTNPNIAIYNFHYAFPEAVDLNYKLNKVIGFNETGFAGKADEIYRRQAWRFIMSGGGLFSHLDYSFSTDHPDGSEDTQEAPGGGSITLRQQLSFLKNFIENQDLNTLKPDQSYVNHIEGAFYQSMKDKYDFMIYIEPVGTEPPLIKLMLPSGIYRIEWYDVATGIKWQESPAKKMAGLVAFKAPEGMKDRILRLSRAR